MTWQPIEQIDLDNPIWVIKYTLYAHPETKEWCSPDKPGAIAHTSCHGWYEDEAQALAALRHFPKPNTYKLEKVYKRTVTCLITPTT